MMRAARQALCDRVLALSCVRRYACRPRTGLPAAQVERIAHTLSRSIGEQRPSSGARR